MQVLTLALTHFNRFALLQESFAKVIDDPRIVEIVISDDHSTDGSWEKILAAYHPHPKAKLHRNKENRDCYRNKRAAVLRSSNPWVILFDSDNIIDPSYLNALESEGELQNNTFYCPDFAQPHFDYAWLGGSTITRSNVCDFSKKGNLLCALNTANYVVPKDGYLAVWGSEQDPHTSDSLWQAYCWLANGGQIKFVKGMRYQHRVHDGSHYKLNHHKTGSFESKAKDAILSLR
jgi:glycosyltransferase involved in cell wall biosynthesis